ncbi:MAG TPA: hypothetical protein VFC93_12485 [Chloroflexota bacterium]|nr:hypothetical protein [Chloroflexota bacterium]
MAATIGELTAMTQEQLDDLFRRADVGPIPNGDGEGTAIVAPGTPIEGIAARFAHWLAWQGKVVDAAKGELLNKVGPFGVRAIRAKVYRAPSWFDGRDAIILDYSKTSLVAHKIRDEIREIAPGTYLGQVYWGRVRILNFVLTFGRGQAS